MCRQSVQASPFDQWLVTSPHETFWLVWHSGFSTVLNMFATALTPSTHQSREFSLTWSLFKQMLPVLSANFNWFSLLNTSYIELNSWTFMKVLHT